MSELQTKDEIQQALSPYHNNQPLFLQVAQGYITRLKSAGQIKILRQVIEEYHVASEYMEAKTNLIRSMEAALDAKHSYDTHPDRTQRQDEIARLTHERDVAKLKAQTNRYEQHRESSSLKREPKDSEAALQREADHKITEKRITYETERAMKELRDKILGGYEQQKSEQGVARLDAVFAEYSRRKAEIENNSQLGPVMKEAQLRALDKEFARRIAEFGE